MFYKIHPFYLLSIIDQTYLFYLFLEASLTSPESSTTGLLNPIFVTPSAKNEDGGISNIAYATLILVVAIVSFLLCVTCCFCCKWTETFEVNFIIQLLENILYSQYGIIMTPAKALIFIDQFLKPNSQNYYSFWGLYKLFEFRLLRPNIAY